MKLGDFWEELKHRRVVRVAVGYAAIGAILVQAADLTFVPLGLPAWTNTFLLVLVLGGFPIALVLAWAFDVTPDGIERAAVTSPNAGGGVGRWAVGAAVMIAVGIGGWRLLGGAEGVEADGVDPGVVAVIPFRVSSTDAGLDATLREGILDLLSPHFSGAPRMVDVGAMVSAWRVAAAGGAGDLSEGQAVELARTLGAGRVIVGSVVGSADRFTATARLLRVPGGALVGDATVEASLEDLGGLATGLSGQLLALEAGEDATRVSYLTGVSNSAVRDYLEGRRFYRLTDYRRAWDAFGRALDTDSTFALAAVGLYESSLMGLSGTRTDLRDRADAVLRANLDRLPPRDREYVRLWVGDRTGRINRVEWIRVAEAVVDALPDKAEAWYELGDRIYHRWPELGLADPVGQSKRAFERALSLDPGLNVARQHLLWQASFESDTTYALAEAPRYLAAAAGTDSEVRIRADLALTFGDTVQLRWMHESRDTLSLDLVVELLWASIGPGASYAPEDFDRLLGALDASAVTSAERASAANHRWRFLRNAGRSTEGDAAFARWESLAGPQPILAILNHLYWDGDRESAERAFQQLRGEVEGEGPISWGSGGADLCYVEVWRLRSGDSSRTGETIGRLRTGADDPDPAHGQNSLCALLLETMRSHARQGERAPSLLADLRRALEQAPSSGQTVSNLESARMLEGDGDFAAASRAAFSPNRGSLQILLYSTMVRESGRLADLAGDTERALFMYRHALQLFQAADPTFDDELERIRTRVAELEAR